MPPGTSHPDYILRCYRVQVREPECPAYWVTIPKAIGIHDAENQARERAREYGIAFDVVAVEEIVGEVAA